MQPNGIPTATLLLILCSSILAAQSPSSSGSIEQARALAAADQLEKANQMLSDLVRRNPQNLLAWQELGEIQLKQKLNDDAMNSFEAVLKDQPDSSKAQAGEARAA